jgi:hypothetical protein
MDQMTVEKLEQRLATLERDYQRLATGHRRMKLAGGIVLCALLAVVVMGQAIVPYEPKTIEAHSFVLRDMSGKVRGALGIADDGSVGINLDDSQGRIRATLDIASVNDTPGLDLYDDQGQVRATLALDTYGTPGLGFYDGNGKLRTSLDIPAMSTPGLGFYNAKGKGVFGLP